MKKDSFNLKQYLVENKMTTNSRGDVRHHFGEVKLDTRILTESINGEEAPNTDTVDAEAMGFYYSRGFVCSNITSIQCKILQNTLPKTEEDLADMMIEVDPEYRDGEKFLPFWEHPEFEEFYILDLTVNGKTIYSAPESSGCKEEMEEILRDGDASRYPDVEEELKQRVENSGSNDDSLDECGDVPNMTLDDQISEDFDQMEKDLDEAGYTDDEEDYDLSDFDYDIPEDPRATKAAQKDIAGDTADIDADIENEPEDAPLDGDEDDEDSEEEPVADEPAAPAGNEITVNDLVPGEGAKAEEMRNNIDILVDLNEFFAEHPTWRIGTLQRDIRTGFREIREFGYKNLYLTPTMQGYDKRLHNTTGRAIIRLRRPESVPEFGV